MIAAAFLKFDSMFSNYSINVNKNKNKSAKLNLKRNTMIEKHPMISRENGNILFCLCALTDLVCLTC